MTSNFHVYGIDFSSLNTAAFDIDLSSNKFYHYYGDLTIKLVSLAVISHSNYAIVTTNFHQIGIIDYYQNEIRIEDVGYQITGQIAVFPSS